MKLSPTLASFLGLALAAEPQRPLGHVSNPESNTHSSSAPEWRESLVSFHKDLVDVSSVTGSEAKVGDFLSEYLQKQGFSTKLQYLPGFNQSASQRRFNVLAWPTPDSDSVPSPKIVVSSHIDTVPPYIPYSRSDEGDAITPETKISGRGSVDAKASVAAQIIAVKDLLEKKKVAKEDVLLLFVVGEEVDGAGMRYFSSTLPSPSPFQNLELKTGIFGEPTENKLACGHKGHTTCTINAKGQAGHSGYPWLGKSATAVLMRALLKIVDTELGSSERFGNTTVNVGTLEGGVAANVIPEHATGKIAVRIAIGPQTGENSGDKVVRQRIEDILAEVDDDALSMECLNGYGSVLCDCEVDGFEQITVNYGTDVPNLQGNHTRYLYGPGDILVAHGDNEALRLKDLETAVEGYQKLILHALDL